MSAKVSQAEVRHIALAETLLAHARQRGSAQEQAWARSFAAAARAARPDAGQRVKP